MNVYAYVNGDPVNLTDPNGMCPFCVVGVILASGGVAFSVDMAAQKLISGKYDALQGAVATGFGMLTGGASVGAGALLELGVVGTAVVNGAIGAAGNVGQAATLNAIDGKNDDLGWAAITGGAGGTLGSLAGSTFTIAGKAYTEAAWDALPLAQKLRALNWSIENKDLTVKAGSTIATATGAQVGNVVGNTISNIPSPPPSPMWNFVPMTVNPWSLTGHVDITDCHTTIRGTTSCPN
jgi:hypothetical protein